MSTPFSSRPGGALHPGGVPALELRAAIDAQRHGDTAGARRRFEQLLRDHPHDPLVVHCAGLNLRLLGRHEEGLALLRRSTDLAPAEAGFWRNLAGALHDQGHLDECARTLAQALGLEPGHTGTPLQLARLELERGRWPDARDLFARLVSHGNLPSRERVDAYVGLAVALSAMNLSPEEALREANRLAPGDPEILFQLGEVALNQGEYERARSAFGESLRLSPALEPAATGLAVILIQEGRFTEARQALRDVLARHPRSFRAWGLLLILKGGDDETPRDLERARRLAADPTIPWDHDPHAATFLLALGGACEETGEYAEAFEFYRRGNRLLFHPERYDARAEAHFVRSLLLATGEAFRRRHAPPPDSTLPFTPVYIVGMPRSGTTLMEEMLAAHPAVSPGGEMVAFHALLLRTLGLRRIGELPARLETATAEEIARLRRETADLLAETARGRPFVTDKMPGNYVFLNLLRTLVPSLRILHMRRNPQDTCFSCYTTGFRVSHEFSYDLTTLGQQYRIYETTLALWRRHLPPALFLDVDYETLVAEPEPTLRRILEFLALPWDPRVLDFHRLERPIQTASVWQVRQPLNRRSVGRAQRFARWLGPLDEALGLHHPLPPPFELPDDVRL